MNIHTAVIVSCLTLILYQPGISQKSLIKVKGEAQLQIEDNLSKQEAKLIAIDLAKINALENAFGTYITQESSIELERGVISYSTIGNTKVKGEWIKTTETVISEDLRIANKKNEIWIKCKIKGEAREILNPKTRILSKPLECDNINCNAIYYFDDGSPFYLYFRTPIDGYLTVFYTENDIAYRILPHHGSISFNHNLPVIEDKEYIFFSKKWSDKNKNQEFDQIDEITLYSEGDRSNMSLYIIFSPKKYSKPILDSIDEDEDGVIPRSIDEKSFQDWLSELRVYDVDMVVNNFTVTVNSIKDQ